MKKLRIFLLLIILMSGCMVCVAQQYKLVKLANRQYTPVSISATLKEEIRRNPSGMTVDDLVVYCHEKTRKLLTFTVKNHKFDDTKVTGMNCVEYAQVCATLCNYAFMINGIKASAKPVVGNVHMGGVNLNSLAKLMPRPVYNFTKNHDFVEVNYKGKNIYYCHERNKIFVDRTIY